MFHSSMELINLAVSNSLFVFFFCNLIIVILFVSSSKPGSQFDEDSATTPLPVVDNRNKNAKKGLNAEDSFHESKALMDVTEVSNARIAVIDHNKRNDDNKALMDVTELSDAQIVVFDVDKRNDDKKALMDVTELSDAQIAVIHDNKRKHDDIDDDELRRRVEEFIEKVNRGWRAERLRTSHLDHTENLQLGFSRSSAI
ncbi:hypothetical protein L1049_020372 [Liquidambar formosana]|uniref:Uncharacterized protein n=1 Tax=Liquidambar formosana TaxID=63359 RepID=A0AAP0XAP7_LIQFO